MGAPTLPISQQHTLMRAAQWSTFPKKRKKKRKISEMYWIKKTQIHSHGSLPDERVRVHNTLNEKQHLLLPLPAGPCWGRAWSGACSVACSVSTCSLAAGKGPPEITKRSRDSVSGFKVMSFLGFFFNLAFHGLCKAPSGFCLFFSF